MPRDALVDGALVLPRRGPLVEGVESTEPNRRADGPAGVLASSMAPWSKWSKVHSVATTVTLRRSAIVGLKFEFAWKSQRTHCVRLRSPCSI
jgi:hypothetical protein